MNPLSTKSANDLNSIRTDLPMITLADQAVLPGITVPIHTMDRKTRTILQKAYQDQQKVVVIAKNSAGWFSEIGCLCEVTASAEAETHGPLVILKGLKRVRIAAIDETTETVTVETVSDHYPAKSQNDRKKLREELMRAFFSQFPEQARNQIVKPMLECDLPFGSLCDLLSFNCKLNPTEYVAILGELDVDQRCDFVLELLMDVQRNPGKAEFPPPFSSN